MFEFFSGFRRSTFGAGVFLLEHAMLTKRKILQYNRMNICKKCHRLVESLGFSASQPHDKFPFKDLYIIVQPLLFIWLHERAMAVLTILSPSKWQLRTPTCRCKSALDFERFWSLWTWMDDLFFPLKAVIFKKSYLGQCFAARDDVLSRFLEPPIYLSVGWWLVVFGMVTIRLSSD